MTGYDEKQFIPTFNSKIIENLLFWKILGSKNLIFAVFCCFSHPSLEVCRILLKGDYDISTMHNYSSNVHLLHILTLNMNYDGIDARFGLENSEFRRVTYVTLAL